MASLKSLPLYSMHKKFGATFIPFAGWNMPLVYASRSIIESHLHTRKAASLFDVSHMSQSRIYGPSRYDFLETLLVSDLKELPLYHAQLTCFVNERGGIIDDCIVQKFPDHIWLVNNAVNANKIHELLIEGKSGFTPGSVSINADQDHCLLSIQGPLSESMICSVPGIQGEAIKALKAGQGLPVTIFGEDCYLSRTGYTGEDGFEISVPIFRNIQETLVAFLLDEHSSVGLGGLGARNTLRLEAGYCLHGNEITPDITPFECGMKWTIGKRYLSELKSAAAKKLAQLYREKASTKLLGLVLDAGSPVPRGQEHVIKEDGSHLGSVTSGSYSPCLERPIAICRVDSSFNHPSGVLQIRHKTYPGKMMKLPFVPSHTKKN